MTAVKGNFLWKIKKTMIWILVAESWVFVLWIWRKDSLLRMRSNADHVWNNLENEDSAIT